MVICLEPDANDFHTVQLMPLPPDRLLLHEITFLVPAYRDCPGKEAVKRRDVSSLYVCVSTSCIFRQFYATTMA